MDINIQTKLITKNKYSRPADKLYSKPKGIVIHWVANPNTSASANRNFFENRKYGKTGYGSAHYIIGLNGEIIQAIPNDEIAYGVGSNTYTSESLKRLGSYPNGTTISVETCHIDWEGNYNEKTYDSMIQLTSYLLDKFDLDIDDIWTHEEVVGWKDCPRLYSRNPSKYEKFKNDVANYMNRSNETTKQVNTEDRIDLNNIGDFYTVRAGDTLWSISTAFDTTVDHLKALNPNVNVYALKVGSDIRIKENQTTNNTNDDEHVIQSGDTLWSLARKYETTISELEKLNPNINIYALKIGDTLKIKQSQKESEESLLPNVVLKYGDTGENVKKLQRALNSIYFKVGAVDGSYGRKTENAISRFQSMYSDLKVDGIFGKNTRTKLLSKLK